MYILEYGQASTHAFYSVALICLLTLQSHHFQAKCIASILPFCFATTTDSCRIFVRKLIIAYSCNVTHVCYRIQINRILNKRKTSPTNQSVSPISIIQLCFDYLIFGSHTQWTCAWFFLTFFFNIKNAFYMPRNFLFFHFRTLVVGIFSDKIGVNSTQINYKL